MSKLADTLRLRAEYWDRTSQATSSQELKDRFLAKAGAFYESAERADEHHDYPTLHAIGLGSQLAELERICAESAKGKHAGETILGPGHDHHVLKAAQHMARHGAGRRDIDTNARHLIHAAARLLMAAACLDSGES